jgi:GNAT superfamily N-acetyltransferase
VWSTLGYLLVTYRIRLVDGCDDEIASDIHSLHEVTFGSSAPQVETDTGYWWLAYHGDEPVAFAGLTKAFSTAETGYLKRSGVLREHRGNRLQVRLLQAREAKARKLGWTWIITDTTNNVASANSLIRAGYTMFTPKHPWAFPNSLYWEKNL